MRRGSRTARVALLAVVVALFIPGVHSSAAALPPGAMPIASLGRIVPVPIPQAFVNRAGAHLTYYGGSVIAVTEYYVMFPPTYKICLGSSCSNAQFCAYHSDAAYAGTTFTYTVLPESTPTNSGCGASSAGDGFGNLTAMTSHELVESMTDPEVGSASGLLPPLGWYDGTNRENWDICNGQQATLTLGASTWTVQRQWSNAETACLVSHGSRRLKGGA